MTACPRECMLAPARSTPVTHPWHQQHTPERAKPALPLQCTPNQSRLEKLQLPKAPKCRSNCHGAVATFDFTDAQAIAAIERTKRGNFRLLERLFPQINRVLKINQLDTITDDVVEAAASILVVGN